MFMTKVRYDSVITVQACGLYPSTLRIVYAACTSQYIDISL